MAGDGAAHLRVHPHGDREPGPVAAAGGDERPGVVRGVRAHHDHAGGTGLPGGVDRLGHQGGRAPGGAGVAAAQPGRRHDRRGQRRAHGGGQHVQPAHQQRLRGDLGVPERRTLLGAPVHPPLHRVDIDERQHLGAGQQRCPRGQLGQYPAVHRGELTHVAVVERPQKATQRRRGADPADRGRDRAVAQQVHPVDGVGAGDHPRHQRTDLQTRVRADLGGHTHMLRDQILQPNVLSQPHRRYQPGVRHQIRIIKRRVCPGRGVQQSHPRGALSILALRASTTRILPGQRALLLSRHTPENNPGGGSRLSHCKVYMMSSPTSRRVIPSPSPGGRIAPSNGVATTLSRSTTTLRIPAFRSA